MRHVAGTDRNAQLGLSWDWGLKLGRRARVRRLAALIVFGMLLVALIPPTSATPTQRGVSDVWSAAGWQDASTLGTYDPRAFDGSMNSVTGQIGAKAYWDLGFNGKGVDIALIDTGVTAVPGLAIPGKVVDGPDLSFDGSRADLRHRDGFGHGTHLAGIIAGRDSSAPAYPGDKDTQVHFVGVAPGARIVNMRAGDGNGAVDVSQVIAAIDWVVEHRNTDGLNIRVLTLAYGTDSKQSSLVDPLSAAVERAWKAGIVVVVAAGNDGNAAPLRNPATNKYVISVGALDGLRTNGASAQPIPDFTPCAGSRTVDLIAPGGSIVSLRVPGSHADRNAPQARVAERFFLGSGTSQAAAVVAGAAALIVEQRPNATPDEIKNVLVSTSASIRKASQACQGAGVVNMWAARYGSRGLPQTHLKATGVGSLELARGSDHLEMGGIPLVGEKDVFGKTFDSAVWASLGTRWNGGTWNGSEWTGVSWSGLSWSGVSWSGLSWSGVSWSGLSWSGVSWSGVSWSGGTWSGKAWS